MARGLSRRLDKVASAVHCPKCGCKLRGPGSVPFDEERRSDYSRRVLADATNEDLEEINRVFDRIHARHVVACARRGEMPVSLHQFKTAA